MRLQYIHVSGNMETRLSRCRFDLKASMLRAWPVGEIVGNWWESFAKAGFWTKRFVRHRRAGDLPGARLFLFPAGEASCNFAH